MKSIDQILRTQSRRLRCGTATINLAGADYQRTGSRYVSNAGRLIEKEDLNLLLSLNPDVFEKASSHCWDLTLAGHTHGGKINLEILHPRLNPATFYTPFTCGMYRHTNSAMYVTSGIGTVGLPARLGTDAEIVLIRLADLHKK